MRAVRRFLCIAGFLLSSGAGAQTAPVYRNPVIPGDHPDPSVIRVGEYYWATSTTSAWAPVFPLMRSRDLVNWTVEGAVFERPPDWTAGSYWAPEISEFRGRFSVYYAARNKQGILCVAVATALTPSGPYKDRGPLVCQPDGSIDPVPAVDEKGRRYLIWKEDGNSKKGPTPIWAQRLSDDGARLTGERTELIRNDSQWEEQLVEGPYILRRGGYFYLFYSGAACCGAGCDYKLGVARAKRLLGPWTKYPGNPIAAGNDAWKCPGHGSIVTGPHGRDYLLYHSYSAGAFNFLGRQAVLDRVDWNRDGWPSIANGKAPGESAESPLGAPQQHAGAEVRDRFDTARLSPRWQWPWYMHPRAATGDGWLRLTSDRVDAKDPIGALVAQAPEIADYSAEVAVDRQSLRPGMTGGLTAYGNRDNAIGVAVRDRMVFVWRRRKGETKITALAASPVESNLVHLSMTVHGGREFRFAYGADGQQWTRIDEEIAPEDLPPWDLGVRVALTAGGVADEVARFKGFRMAAIE